MSHDAPIVSEKHLTPDEVEVLDARRRRGHLLLIIGLQTAVVTTLLSVLWVGQDLVQSPGWLHPIAYWAALTGTTSIVSFLWGMKLRSGFHEFTSY
jgi:hypothetical protein